MATAPVIRSKGIENSAVTLMAHIVAGDGEAAQQADVQSLLLKVYDNTTGTLVEPDDAAEPYEGTELVVADVILDTPTSGDARWPYTPGANFIFEMNGSFLPEGGKVYQVEVKITPSVGAPYYALWQIATTNIFSE